MWHAPSSVPFTDPPETVAAADQPLLEVLRWLQSRGLPVMFSSRLVSKKMRVAFDFGNLTDRQILDLVLQAHGLRVQVGPGGALMVVREAEPNWIELSGQVKDVNGTPLNRVRITTLDGDTSVSDERGSFILRLPEGSYVTLMAQLEGYYLMRSEFAVSQDQHIDLSMTPIPTLIEEIVVMPSQVALLDRENAPPPLLSSEEIDVLPRIADDLYRALSRLPGTAGGDISAKFSVRGGLPNEVLVLLDDQEIYEPYHLRHSVPPANNPLH